MTHKLVMIETRFISSMFVGHGAVQSKALTFITAASLAGVSLCVLLISAESCRYSTGLMHVNKIHSFRIRQVPAKVFRSVRSYAGMLLNALTLSVVAMGREFLMPPEVATTIYSVV